MLVEAPRAINVSVTGVFVECMYKGAGVVEHMDTQEIIHLPIMEETFVIQSALETLWKWQTVSRY